MTTAPISNNENPSVVTRIKYDESKRSKFEDEYNSASIMAGKN